MRKFRSFGRNLFDVRKEERGRTLFMSLFLFFTLFSYYIVKPASRGMFLGKFDLDQLPSLYILLAAAGGLFAYGYTRLAVKASLRRAVDVVSLCTVASMIAIWWLLGFQPKWMLYVFNIFTSMFSIVTVTQCWVVAANVFSSREAKRVYTLLGLGAVLGAFCGSLFTTYAVPRISAPRDLLWAAAAIMVVAYGAFRMAIAQEGVSLAGATAAETTETEFSFRDIAVPLVRYRHLQVIFGITLLMLMVDVVVEFQMQSSMKRAFGADAKAITRYIALYVGLWGGILNSSLQLLAAGLIVRWFGVGGTLQVMPASVAVLSLSSAIAPSLSTTTSARLGEAALRYTVQRMGAELLYLPLPLELRNRTKAFIDIFVDRMGRGVGGLLLKFMCYLPFTRNGENTRPFAVFVLLLTAGWSVLAWLARKEYVATMRKRIESRRLDLETLRITVQDAATIEMIEQTARSPNPRQASYALGLLAEVPGYLLEPLLLELVASPVPEVRGKIFELGRRLEFPALLDSAHKEIRSSLAGHRSEAIQPAVSYAVAFSPEKPQLAARLINHPNCLVAEAALETLGETPEVARELIGNEWLAAASQDANPDRRRLAAVSIGVRGDQGTEALCRLLADPNPSVTEAACHTAAVLQNRTYVHPLLQSLSRVRVRRAAIEALAVYGTRVVGTLGDVLEDAKLPVTLRRQIPRVLRRIPCQRSVDLLLGSVEEPDLSIRTAVIRALGRLRESAPNLDYGPESVARHILHEARGYFELSAALEPFRDQKNLRTAAGLLAATIEERLRQTVERLFRLLGLRYPPKEIHAAYMAVNRRRSVQVAAAIEFLENILDRELKKTVLPLLDESAHPGVRRELFGIEDMNAEQAIRQLIRGGDTWLTSCAMATAAELKLRSLAPDIRQVTQIGGEEVALVGRAALAALT